MRTIGIAIDRHLECATVDGYITPYKMQLELPLFTLYTYIVQQLVYSLVPCM